ncbi:MAG TPA: dihydrodipicolinate synthase family protein [Gemmataceae bacterium]|nr:dihydrodipicolinate synthase family protein [Gemmataceae bacterium]
MNWQGVIPAMTTAFKPDYSVDHEFVAKHASWLIDNGCTGIVALGSLGEGATLTDSEKAAILKTLVQTLGKRAPVAAGISALSTAEAVRLAKMAAEIGCQGLMVLPPYVYSTDWREMKAHIVAVLKATPLTCMLYNNPIAYKTDFLPEQIAELAAEHSNLVAVKESSADARRVTSIRALLGKRLQILVGVDDVVVEGVQAGAVGWIAGLVNAFPKESVALFQGAQRGVDEKLFQLYSWFLPLLRMDVVPKFVQLIKLAQAAVGMGNARVRPPRLELEGEELKLAQNTLQTALKSQKR